MTTDDSVRVAAGEPAAAHPRSTRPRRRIPETAALILVLLGMVVFFSIRSPYFFGGDNLVNILVTASVIGIIAAPATLLLVAGQFDLSVGSGAAFVGVVMAATSAEFGVPVGVVVAIVAGLLVGIVNGVAVTVFGINALITTLGTLAILRGLSQVIADGQTLFAPGFEGLGGARPFLNIPVPVLIFLGAALITALAMRFTVYGRGMYAIGANPVAARLVGIRTKLYVFGGFVLSAGAVVLGGLILTSQLGAASPVAASGLELSVVTAVILGGASLAGGRGTVFGTLLGVLILGVLNNGMTLLNVNSYWQDVARGGLLLTAVGFDQLRLRIIGERAAR